VEFSGWILVGKAVGGFYTVIPCPFEREKIFR
jgi:hypothetical protein